MDYAIFTSDGNMLERFSDYAQGRVALQRAVLLDPDAVDSDALLGLGDDDVPTGETVFPDHPDRVPGVAGPLVGSLVQNVMTGTLHGKNSTVIEKSFGLRLGFDFAAADSPNAVAAPGEFTRS